jgi:hypothetical protein
VGERGRDSGGEREKCIERKKERGGEVERDIKK